MKVENFIAELKRRNGYQVAIRYAVIASWDDDPTQGTPIFGAILSA